MSLAGLAKETLEICERGVYRAPSGATVSIRGEVDRAVAGTVLYRPEDFDTLVVAAASTPSAPRVEGAFDRVVFAVYDRGKRKENLRAFQARFGG